MRNNELTQEEKDAFQNALATIRRVHNMALPPRYSPEVCIQVAVKCQILYGTINGILYANTQAYWRLGMPPFIYGEEENLSDEDAFHRDTDLIDHIYMISLRPENDREVQIRIRIKCQELYVSILGFFRENTQEYFELGMPPFIYVVPEILSDENTLLQILDVVHIVVDRCVRLFFAIVLNNKADFQMRRQYNPEVTTRVMRSCEYLLSTINDVFEINRMSFFQTVQPILCDHFLDIHNATMNQE
ncbi:hypothetical protein B9Z55_026189 [Caenorhabditis nigoni]|uniref:Uncharacterized protein n=1 Tax=Caenorhabditis nigoni TaxID=1611254 RepID=A0A2G5T277_9PELO|nr:hypothetical protein B9Z55_026189 [Caenorhabditis nigoni]